MLTQSYQHLHHQMRSYVLYRKGMISILAGKWQITKRIGTSNGIGQATVATPTEAGAATEGHHVNRLSNSGSSDRSWSSNGTPVRGTPRAGSRRRMARVGTSLCPGPASLSRHSVLWRSRARTAPVALPRSLTRRRPCVPAASRVLGCV